MTYATAAAVEAGLFISHRTNGVMIHAAYILAGMLGLAAVVCLALIGRYWRTVGHHISDWWAKAAAKIAKAVAAGIGVGSAYFAGVRKEDWAYPAAAGVVVALLWDLVESLADNRVKAADRADRKELTAARAESEALTNLLAAFRHLADNKVFRLTKALSGGPSKKPKPANLDRARTALAPDDHIQEVLQSLEVFLHARREGGRRAGVNVRIGLYVDQNGVMVPTHGYDSKQPGVNSFRSYQESRDSFRLTCTDKPALAVQCVRERKSIIVEDAVKAEQSGQFTFYHDDQKSYLKSLLAYDLGEVCDMRGTMTKGALVIDVNCPDFFRLADQQDLESAVQEFATRIRLELLLDAVLNRKG